MGAQHRREDDTVENDVVLADEVHHFRLLVFPVLFPVGRQLLRGRDVADRRIEPDVQHFALGSLDRNGNPPVQIAAHGAGLEPQIEPALALAVHVDFPLLVPFENPLAQESFVLVERQEPVRRLAQHRNRTGDRAARVDQVGGVQRAAALLALVAVGAIVAAVGAGPDDVAVGQKLSGLLVVILHRRLLGELALVVQRAEKVRGRLVMHGRRGARVDVERYAEPFERVLDDIMVFVDDILRSDPFLTGLDRDRNAVFVRPADRDDVLAPEAQVAHVDVRRNVDACEVADMDRSVGVRQGRGDKIAFEFFHVFGVMCRFPTKLGIFRQTWLACTPYSCFNRLGPAFFAVGTAPDAGSIPSGVCASVAFGYRAVPVDSGRFSVRPFGRGVRSGRIGPARLPGLAGCRSSAVVFGSARTGYEKVRRIGPVMRR